MRVYQVQRNLPVDLARCAPCGNLKLVRVYSTHILELLFSGRAGRNLPETSGCASFTSSSKDELEPHLDVSSRRRGGNLAEAGIRSGDGPERDTGVVKVGLVKSIEEISLVPKLDAFCDVEQFASREVPQTTSRTDDNPDACFTEATIGRWRECKSVEPPCGTAPQFNLR